MTGPAGIDIIVPFWGDPALLEETVESVRSQSDPDWRLVVVDDCYPDPAVAARFAAERDPRIQYVRNESNLGVAGNFQRCRDLVEADLCVFVGCDDRLRPEFVRTVRAAHAHFPGAAVVQPGVAVIDEEGRPADPLTDRVKRAIRPRARGATVLGGEELAASLLRGNWLYWPSLVFRTERLRRYQFRPDLPIVLDLALLVDMVLGGERLVVEPTVVFDYRRHVHSVSSGALLHGDRLADDRAYYALARRLMRRRGWPRAGRAATWRWTSRLHGVTLLPAALATREPAVVGRVARHVLGGRSDPHGASTSF
jgi:glycosyltransferase involved in cell wall biosynthesis